MYIDNTLTTAITNELQSLDFTELKKQVILHLLIHYGGNFRLISHKDPYIKMLINSFYGTNLNVAITTNLIRDAKSYIENFYSNKVKELDDKILNLFYE